MSRLMRDETGARVETEDVGTGYAHGLRATARWWKPPVALVVLLVAFFAASLAGVRLAALVDGASAVGPTGSVTVTPALLAAVFLAPVVLVPVAVGLVRWLHRRGPGALVSVTGAPRWRWLGRCLLLAGVVLVPAYVVYALVPAMSSGLWGTAPPPANPWPWLLVAVVLVPLQASAEEVAFRGLLLRSVAGCFRSPAVGAGLGVAVSAVVFGALHAATDPWVLGYYVGFGAVLGVLAVRTEGLEAPVALHVVNNLVSSVVGSLVADPAAGIDRSAGSPAIVLHLAVLGVVAFLLDRSYRGRGARTVLARPTVA